MPVRTVLKELNPATLRYGLLYVSVVVHFLVLRCLNAQQVAYGRLLPRLATNEAHDVSTVFAAADPVRVSLAVGALVLGLLALVELRSSKRYMLGLPVMAAGFLLSILFLCW